MSTAQDLPYGAPLHAGPGAPALRLVPVVPLDFDESVRRIRPRLHRYAVRRLGDLHEAEELVQEALLRAYSHRAQLLTEDDLAAWATVVTGRLVIDRLRVRGRSINVAEVPEGYRVSRDTAELVVARDEARTALDALDAMPARQAALLWAREVEGQSYGDLCARFGMTEPAVRSVLTRARKALRKEYSARGGTLPVGGLAVLAPWITGLGWADRLRRAASRVTAPAALSAVGITALGGLVLSPFAFAPDRGTTTYRPEKAVVSTFDRELPAHTGALVPSANHPAAVGHSTSTAPGTLKQLLSTLPNSTPCVNDTDSRGDHGTISLPSTTGDPSAGPSSCDGFASTPRKRVWVDATLPDNPTGVRQIGVSSTDVDCAAIANNPLVKCSPDHTQQGAQQ